jgi:hypothetical protein
MSFFTFQVFDLFSVVERISFRSFYFSGGGNKTHLGCLLLFPIFFRIYFSLPSSLFQHRGYVQLTRKVYIYIREGEKVDAMLWE